MWEKLKAVEKRYEELAIEMAQPDVAGDYDRLQSLVREQSSLEELMSLHRRYQVEKEALSQAEAVVKEGGDDEIIALASEEIAEIGMRMETLEGQLRSALLPKDPFADKNVIVEVRAAAGGQEAALFAGDLFRMYSYYAERMGWKVDIISRNSSDLGGFREIVFEVRGKGAYADLKYESGVHRVQRVPVTEASGRIHTSTATVAVLPEADEVDVLIDDKDLRVDVFMASGHGGQNVQKNATAIRITHLPTGIVAACQDERSQLKNRMKAMAVLRSRLLQIEESKKREEIESSRRAQLGSGERAEKIRTYNFPQDRVTDHRIGLTLHNIPALLAGQIDPVIEALRQNEQAEQLQAMSLSAGGGSG